MVVEAAAAVAVVAAVAAEAVVVAAVAVAAEAVAVAVVAVATDANLLGFSEPGFKLKSLGSIALPSVFLIQPKLQKKMTSRPSCTALNMTAKEN